MGCHLSFPTSCLLSDWLASLVTPLTPPFLLPSLSVHQAFLPNLFWPCYQPLSFFFLLLTMSITHSTMHSQLPFIALKEKEFPLPSPGRRNLGGLDSMSFPRIPSFSPQQDNDLNGCRVQKKGLFWLNTLWAAILTGVCHSAGHILSSAPCIQDLWVLR